MLRESKELTQMAKQQNNNNNSYGNGNNMKSSSSPDASFFGEFNPNNSSNSAGGVGGVVGGGAIQSDMDMSGNGLDAISRRELLSKLAAGCGGGMNNNPNITVDDQLSTSGGSHVLQFNYKM